MLELLIAVALFGLIATVLFGNVRFGMKVWHQGSARADATDRSIMVQNLLRRLIGEAYPHFLQTDPARAYVAFNGGRESVHFLSGAPEAMGGGGRFRFVLLLGETDGRASLVLDATPELGNPEKWELTSRSTLLTDIDHVRLSYFGVSPMQKEGRWQDTWTQRSELPRLVRVRIGFGAGDTRTWSDLVISPRITADVGCVFDPLTLRCRGR